MANVWDGKHIWIWDLPACEGGNIPAIISKVKAAGFRGIILKAHDGENVWPQFASAVQAFKDAGLIVGAWGYCYGANVSGEAQAAHQAFLNGADWYIADAEAEYEGKQGAAVTFGQLLRSWMPKAILGYSSFPFGNLHQTFPYKEFSAFCDVAVPQVYWNELEPKADECIDTTMAWYQQFGKPVAPAGCAFTDPGQYVAQDGDYTLLENACKKYGITGVSFWSYQHATADMWASMTRLSFPVQVVVDTPVALKQVAPDDYAVSAIAKAVKAGIFTGDENGNINPKDPLTREDFCVALERTGILDEILRVKGITP